MCKLHLSTLKCAGVHRFLDLSNSKCDIGSFPSGSALGPSGNMLLFSPRHPLEICTSSDPHPPSMGEVWIFSGATHLQKKYESICMHQVEDSMTMDSI